VFTTLAVYISNIESYREITHNESNTIMLTRTMLHLLDYTHLPTQGKIATIYAKPAPATVLGDYVDLNCINQAN